MYVMEKNNVCVRKKMQLQSWKNFLVSHHHHHILFPTQKPNKVQCNNIQSYRDGELPEKQVLIKHLLLLCIMQENFSSYRFTVVYCNPTIIINPLEDGF